MGTQSAVLIYPARVHWLNAVKIFQQEQSLAIGTTKIPVFKINLAVPQRFHYAQILVLSHVLVVRWSLANGERFRRKDRIDRINRKNKNTLKQTLDIF